MAVDGHRPPAYGDTRETAAFKYNQRFGGLLSFCTTAACWSVDDQPTDRFAPGMASRMRHDVQLVFCSLALLVSACGLAPGSSTAMEDPGDHDLMAAMELRHAWGLRDDPAWVEHLAADPAAVERGHSSGIGIPVTESESVEVAARERRTAEIGRTLADWVDQQRGGVTVAAVAGNLDGHRAAIRRLFAPDAPVEVRLAAHPLRELGAVAARIQGDTDWVKDLGVAVEGVGVDQQQNVVVINVLSDRLDAADLVVAHYGDATPIRVDVRPDTRWMGGFGEIVVVASDGSGRPIEGLGCVLRPDDPRALPDGPSGTPTLEDGTCTEAVGATGYLVQLVRSDSGQPVVVAERRVVIAPGETEVVAFTVNP